MTEMTERQKRRIKAVGLTQADFELVKAPEKPKEALVEDEQGNKYRQTIKDGKMVLKLVEDYKGICHI